MINKIALFVCILLASISNAQFLPEKPKMLVNDYAAVLKSGQLSMLEGKLRMFEHKTQVEIAIIITPNINGFASIEDYSYKVFNSWGIGKRGASNGILFVNALAERKIRIEVGQGLEGIITDYEASRIISSIKPLLKAGNYYEAYDNVATSLISTIGTMTPEERQIQAEQTRLANEKKSAENWESAKSAFFVILSILLIGGVIFAIYWFATAPRRERERKEEEERIKKENERYAAMIAKERANPRPKKKTIGTYKSSNKKADDEPYRPIIVATPSYYHNDDDSRRRNNDSDTSSNSGFDFGGGSSMGGGASGDY